MEPAKVGRADVHARTPTHGLEALEDLNVLRAVAGRRGAPVLVRATSGGTPALHRFHRCHVYLAARMSSSYSRSYSSSE